MHAFFKLYTTLFVFVAFGLFAQQPDPLRSSDAEAQIQWVDSIYSKLSLEQKIGQLFMPMVFSNRDTLHYQSIERLVAAGKVGGVLYSLGTPERQLHWTNALQEKAQVPLLVAMDAEWGVGMRLQDVQDFPWNMTLGAHASTQTAKQIGYRMGLQSKRLGVHFNFAPVADVNSNPKNPIIGNRAFGENPETVADFAVAIHQGYNLSGGLTSAKHFPGHGDTQKDSHKTLPTVDRNRKELDAKELIPFKRLIEAGVSSIMVAHLNLPQIERAGLPSTLSYKIVTEILQEQLGFNGLVVTDALDMKGVSQYQKGSNIDLLAFMAGNDLLLLSEDIPAGISSIKKAYNQGQISESRLARSVKKILKAKYWAGLHQYSPIHPENATADLNNDIDTAWIAQAFREALTLLENTNDILPLKKNQKLGHIALGDAEDYTFHQTLGSYIDITGLTDNNLEDWLATHPKTPLVVSFHRANENPWEPFDFDKKMLKQLQKWQKSRPIILVPFVKPYALKSLKFRPDALLWAYQNSEIAQRQAAQALVGLSDIQGKLPVSSGNYSVGSGIKLQKKVFWEQVSAQDQGFSITRLSRIDSLAKEAIDQKMTPGMQILIAKNGDLVYHKAFGHHTYAQKRPVALTDVYDLASLTKILATLPVVIQAVDRGELSLDEPLGKLLPDFKNSNKADLSLRALLSHYAGLQPWIPFYKETLDEDNHPLKKWYRKKPNKRYNIAVGPEMYLKEKFHKFIRDSIRESPLLDSLEYKYSDLPYYLLQYYLEDSYQRSLSEIVLEQWIQPLGLERTGYKPLQWISKDSIVPSERDTYFRQMELRGQVHDMGAALLGGIGGHAGLFSNAFELGKMMQVYLDRGKIGQDSLFSAAVFDQFNRRSFATANVRRGIGFDKPQFSGEGPAGPSASPESFGHLGFTGTYVWADPKHELIVVILSNRTYPSMDRNAFSKQNIRTRMHQAVYEALIPSAL